MKNCIPRSGSRITWLVLLLLILMFPEIMHAQKTGVVSYPELGLSFTIPAGWIGQESGEVFIMGSNTEPGFILMMEHEYENLEAIKLDADGGLEDEGISLKRSGNFELFGSNGIGAEFTGVIQNQAAKAYIIGLIGPKGGGVTVIVAVETAKYSSKYKQLAQTVAGSVQFSAPQLPAVVQQWKTDLKNKRLAYLASSYSPGTSSGSYTSVSEREEIILCAAGYFTYNSNSSGSFDSSQAMGHSSQKNKGNGSWDVISQDGGAALQLTFNNGKIMRYSIGGIQKGKLYLNGYGYFYSNASSSCP